MVPVINESYIHHFKGNYLLSQLMMDNVITVIELKI